ncbi:MAG: hypothetical protein HYU57_01680 [Micavibrio aeruginosavorus]|nr:hypothetical protein [Micavibrio aeruginosavorus]
MRGVTILCLLLAMPFLAALGHDIYITYQDQDFAQPLKLSALGYLWVHYGPESYKWAESNIDKGTWELIQTWLLEQKTVLVTAVPALVIYALFLILKLFHLPPFSDGASFFPEKKQKGSDFTFSDGQEQKKTLKYKRK